MIKSFRGKLADGGQDRIRLSTNDGLTGYKITKFELLPAEVAVGGGEHTCRVSKFKFATIDNSIDLKFIQ